MDLAEERDFAKTVGYNSSYKGAMTEVTAGTARAAFLFSATQKSEMREIVGADELMPQKSTFFYPKLLTGLVAYPHFEPAAFVRTRKEKGRDTRRGGRKIQIVPTVAAQMKAEGERKEAEASAAKAQAEEEVKAKEENAESQEGEKPQNIEHKAQEEKKEEVEEKQEKKKEPGKKEEKTDAEPGKEISETSSKEQKKE